MKILVVGPSWVGDMVMAQSLFKKCRMDHPDAVIDVVAPAWSQPILNRMPEVRHTIVLPVGHGQFRFSTRRQIGLSLRDERYDRAIVMPKTWKSALVPYFANIPRRTGFIGEVRYGLLNDRRKLDKKVLTQTVLRYLALGCEKAEALPPVARFYPRLDIDRDNQQKLMRELSLSTDRPVVCFFPGAEYGTAKQWSAGHFHTLADRLVSSGYQVWIMGSEKEAQISRSIQNGTGKNGIGKNGISRHCINLCGRTKLEDAIDLMALASHAVTNDSGLMHVAAAVGVTTEAIYGSSSPYFTPPLTRKKNIHYIGIDCSPCFKRTCPLDHLNCLQQISPARIYESIADCRDHSFPETA